MKRGLAALALRPHPNPHLGGAGRAREAGEGIARLCAMAGAPDRIRTCGLWLRRPTLYPTELRAHAGEP